NVYTGGTAIFDGVLALATNNVLPDANQVNIAGATGILRLNSGVSDTIDVLTGIGSVELQSGATLSIGSQNSGATYGGTIFGAGSLTKLGLDTEVFTGSNSFTGTLTVSGGSVQLGS